MINKLVFQSTVGEVMSDLAFLFLARSCFSEPAA